MSLASDVSDVRKFLDVFRSATRIEDALTTALTAEQAADAARKRHEASAKAAKEAEAAKDEAFRALTAAKSEAQSVLEGARKEAAAIKAEARKKGEEMVTKAEAKFGAIETQATLAQEKFAAQKQTNQEVLDMMGAQIAHAEAKLSEIRAAIANLTKA